MQLRKAITLALASSGMLFSAHHAVAADPVTTDALGNATTTNFVTIVIDDMGFSDMGSFGGEVPTPHLDALANSGVILNNFYASSTSSPSRAMLFTGKDNHAVGMGNMGGATMRPEQIGQPGYAPQQADGSIVPVLSLDTPAFPKLLQDSGYHTMMVGKWHMGEEMDYRPISRGFTETRALLLPGGDVHFLADADGNIITSQWHPLRDADGNLVRDAEGNRIWEAKEDLYVKNGELVTQFPATGKEIYAADYFTDEAVAMLDSKPAGTPFYLNMSYLSTHTPMQAPTDVTAKYVDTYKKGWDVLRAERFARQQALGIVAPNATLPPRPDTVPAWDSLDPQVQLLEATRMAVYAAMVENLDNNVGKLIQTLKDKGEYNNTVFFVYSDNGAEIEAPIFSFPGPRTVAVLEKFPYSLQNFVTDPADPNFDQAKFDELLANLGTSKSYIDPGEPWGNLMSVPFTQYKATSFEGGVHTAGFVTYPQSNLSGFKYDCLTSVMDIAPTALDIAGATYPAEWKGQALTPMEGVSMAGLLQHGQFYCNPDRYLGFEMDGVKGLRKGNWKLSQKAADESWYMFDLANDPSETMDLAGSEDPMHKMKFAELSNLYFNDYSKRNGVIPVSNKRLDNLGAVNADGSNSEAVFTGGDGIDGTFVQYTKTTMDMTDPTTGSTVTVNPITGSPLTPDSMHDIAAQMRPAPGDVGKPGNYYVYGSYELPNPDGSMGVLNFALTPQGLEIVPDFNALPPAYKAMPEGLSMLEFVQVWNGPGLSLPGKITLNFAYSTDDGAFVISKDPISITIPEPAAPAA